MVLRPAIIASLHLSLFHLIVNTQSCWRDVTCTSPTETAFPSPWEGNIYVPSSRTVTPKSILSLASGHVISNYPGPAILTGNGSSLVFDFGIEVGGVVTVDYTSSGPGSLRLAFTETKDYVGE